MSQPLPSFDPQATLAEALGYLNFSSGASDAKFLRGLNELFRLAARAPAGESPADAAAPPVWRRVELLLREKLAALGGSNSGAFRDAAQCEAVLSLTFDRLLPAYREFHSDLLFHQTEATLFNSFFVGRAFEAILAQGPPWDEPERIVAGAVTELNDFLGHRPVAVLETEQKIEPYPHELLRPVPLFIAGVGAATGPYEELIALTMSILQQTDRQLLDTAWFDPALVDELALDLRAYDFNHPANKRPNYHFGQWDPHRIDNQGRYRRFVVQQVTLDGLLSRVDENSELPREQLLLEAASVLAGTILMASGTSGSGPDTHDSTVTLSKLLPRIAGYRDEFYKQRLALMPAEHAARLRAEAVRLKQPFAAARQHLNATLARGRAVQLQHVHLAQLFARMGYDDAAMHQAGVVPVVSARMLCQIQCLLSAGDRLLDRGHFGDAIEILPRVVDLLQRGIECGAIVDPWNILGFGGNYSLFPAIENSVPDPRIDELLDLMDQIFALYSRCWIEAALIDESLEKKVSTDFFELAVWWDRHAATTVASVRKVLAIEAHLSAELVAGALHAWHKAGSAAGDTAFWRPHVEMFDYPKAYARVIETLLDKRDLVASMAVLVHWLGQAERVRLEDGPNSFHLLSLRWLTTVLAGEPSSGGQAKKGDWLGAGGDAPKKLDDRDVPVPFFPSGGTARPTPDRWKLVGKFFDFMEANAETFWQAPRLEFEFQRGDEHTLGDELFALGDDELDEADDDEQGLFGAAYDDMIYRDSTNDGYDSEMLEAGDNATDHELEAESKRLSGRLAFLATLARMWKLVAMAVRGCEKKGTGSKQALQKPETSGERDVPVPFFTACPRDDPAEEIDAALQSALAAWQRQAGINSQQLAALTRAVHRHRIAEPDATEESLIQYDRQRWVKEGLLDRIIATSAAMLDARRALAAALEQQEPKSDCSAANASASDAATTEAAGAQEAFPQATAIWQALLRRDVDAIRRQWPEFMESLAHRPLLYVPLAKGGDPTQILAARSMQQLLRELLAWLPRLGLLRETCQLIAMARTMEKNQSLGAGAVTEFDRLFEIGYKAIVECLILSAATWPAAQIGDSPDGADGPLIESLQQLTESLLGEWLAHSRSLRLSVLEKIGSQAHWKALVAFVDRYGQDLFSQRFLNLGNLRAILHQGLDAWFDRLQQSPGEMAELRLVEDLASGQLPREDAKKHLALVLEAIVENYAEYRDYNSTTTQSDRGEQLYTLLDFLRVKVGYERVNWNLRPVVMAHEVLVRQGRSAAAESWREAMAERTAEAADQHWQKFVELQTRHGMKLPTIAARLAERFVRPLALDRIRALVQPAVEEARLGLPPMAFSLLEQEADEMAQEPAGSGLDVPDWLGKLEEEVDHACSPTRRSEERIEAASRIEPVTLGYEEIQDQLTDWGKGSE